MPSVGALLVCILSQFERQQTESIGFIAHAKTLSPASESFLFPLRFSVSLQSCLRPRHSAVSVILLAAPTDCIEHGDEYTKIDDSKPTACEFQRAPQA
jgi:hypothetical protein